MTPISVFASKMAGGGEEGSGEERVPEYLLL